MSQLDKNVTIPRHIFRTIARAPVDFMYFLGEHDIDPRAYYWADTQLRAVDYQKFWQALNHNQNHFMLPLEIGGHLNIDDLDLFEYSLMNCRILAEAVVAFTQHYDKLGYGGFRFSESEDELSIMFSPNQHVPGEHGQCVILYFIALLRLLSGFDIQSKATYLPRSSTLPHQSGDTDFSHPLLGEKVVFRSPLARISFSKTDLAREIIWQDSALKSLVSKGNLDNVRAYMAAKKPQDYFKAAIDEALVFDDLDKPQIISQIQQLLPSTDKKQLEEAFTDILDEVRKDWATKHMRQQYEIRELTQISRRLGYHKTQGYLERDYQRWTNQPLLVSTIIID